MRGQRGCLRIRSSANSPWINPMLRCPDRPWSRPGLRILASTLQLTSGFVAYLPLLAGLAVALSTWPHLAQAQVNVWTPSSSTTVPKARLIPLPPNGQRGQLVVVAPPAVTINGQAMRLSPGVRVHGTAEHYVMISSLVGQSLAVNYSLDAMHQVREIWLLRDEEVGSSAAVPARANGSHP